jgi:aminoglycoside phosphotransferase (APT) family kinase protein
MTLYHDIPNSETFVSVEPVTKGWSSDAKYRVERADGVRMLLRVSDIAELERKRSEYELLERVYALGVPVPKPLGFGVCNDGMNCYSLCEWLDGEDVEVALPCLSETEQYVLGIKAGELLRKIHALPIPEGVAEWQTRFFAVIDERIDAFRSYGTPFSGSEFILDYLQQNRSLLLNRPQAFIHGDFHEGNLIFSNGELFVIDLLDEGFGNCGDPWYDFKTFGENENAHFSTGFVRGYFGGEPPQTFWDVLTYYIVNAALTSIVWNQFNKPDELPEALRWNEANAAVLREGRSPLMKWYLSSAELIEALKALEAAT